MGTMQRLKHISRTNQAYVMIQLVTCTPDVWLPVTIYLNLITFLVDEIYYKHWKGSEHCIGFVSHCTYSTSTFRVGFPGLRAWSNLYIATSSVKGLWSDHRI